MKEDKLKLAAKQKSKIDLRKREIFRACSVRKGNTPTKEARDYFQIGFCEGARYADAHPISPWISFEDELPDDNEVVVIAYKCGDGIRYGSDVYHSDFGWEGYDDDAIIAWMPIPELPKGGTK